MPMYDASLDSQSEQHDHSQGVSRPTSPMSISHAGHGSGRSSPVMMFNPYYTGRPKTPLGTSKGQSVDRQEIIRRIKSREDKSRPSSPEIERQRRSGTESSTGEPKTVLSPHLRNAEIRAEVDNKELGMQIERPRSALHRGDFRDKEESVSGFSTFQAEPTQPPLSTSPPPPWHSGFPNATFKQAWNERRLHSAPDPASGRPFKSRAVSNSAFLYQAPTSPLVNQSRPDTPPLPRRSSRSPDKRRHTFSPQALQRFASDIGMSSSQHAASPTPAVPTLRKESTFPYQAHQPRRSLNSFGSFGLQGSPPRSALSIRRPSASEAHSPLHHAHMVGSYEESILRGRMSTTPSKPLNFVAQIGVLGKGSSCKPSLRCPPHVTVPFPAVFYSYGATGRPNSATDQPSPYVGLVDLENSLASADSPDKRRQRLGERLQAALSDEGSRASSRTRDDGSSGADIAQKQRQRRRQKAKRRSGSPKAPPGGCYRIPQQGQLQIVIKNPNKTAVKLFLVPYDLSDMVPGQKTFIRQRSYSAGPIIDMPLSSREGIVNPEASLSNSDDPSERPVLRYLIHLNICCTGRGRFWLYKGIRVVFANRVPDGKEKLRNEIQLPDPRYSTYKPNVGPSSPNSPTTQSRRRSDQEMTLISQKAMTLSLPLSEELSMQAPRRMSAFPYPATVFESRPSSRQANDMMELDSEYTRSEDDPMSPTSSITLSDRPMSPFSPARGLGEAFSFERSSSRECLSGVGRNGESLLSLRLRGSGK